MIRIALPSRLAALAIVLTLTCAPGAIASPVSDGASAPPPAWSVSWRSSWLPLEWLSPRGGSAGALAASSQSPGLRVFLDPVTRKPVRPTAEQRRALQENLAPEIDRPYRITRLPNGGELLHLDGRDMVFSVVRRDASGRFVRTCVADSAQAARVLAQPLPAAPKREVR